MKRVIEGPKQREKLPDLMEGYFFGLGEVCYRLFGAKGEEAIYLAVGSFFLRYIEEKMGISFRDPDPWKLYCNLIEFATSCGFFSKIELEELPDKKYRMLECNQFGGKVWNEQKSWERGTAPCPLWALILAALAEIGYKVVLESGRYVEEANGYESIFRFEKIKKPKADILEITQKRLLGSMLTFCCVCGKIRRNDGRWVSPEAYLCAEHDIAISHGYCPQCYEEGKARLKA